MSSSWSIAVGFASVLALTVVVPTPARAEEPQRATDAQDHYTMGRESYRLGLYGRALEEFERSFAFVRSPNTRLYLARTLRELGRWSEAAEQYAETMRDAEERGPRYAATRQAADEELRDVRVRLERAAPPAKVDRDDRLAPRVEAEPLPARRERPADRGPNALTFVSGGVAGAGAASFIVLYALASDRYRYLEENCTQTRDVACDAACSTGKTEEIGAYVSLGVAVVAAAVAVVSLVVPSSSKRGAPIGAPRAMGPGVAF